MLKIKLGGVMKERPILFNTEMVCGVQDGRKTHTRRVIKGNPYKVFWNPIVVNGYGGWTDDHGRPVKCPYGKIGDRLWVRQTFTICSQCGKHLYKSDNHKSRFGKDFFECPACGFNERGWKPSIHMPRRASRITLEITDIRVERVQDIREIDILKEGVGCPLDVHFGSIAV